MSCGLSNTRYRILVAGRFHMALDLIGKKLGSESYKYQGYIFAVRHTPWTCTSYLLRF
jgi:hypothetical protein